MKNYLSTLCGAALIAALIAGGQAASAAEAPVLEVIPGECILDGIFSSPRNYIHDMDGFEVPLVVSWRPAEQDHHRYVGEARFGVFNFKIGAGKLIDSYTVDIGLILGDPDITEAGKDNQLVYSCEDDSDRCTATLVAVKTAITEQIARENRVRTADIRYQKEARATLLGVFVKGLQQPAASLSGDGYRPYRLTEVCGMYELTLTEGHAISSLIRQSVKPN